MRERVQGLEGTPVEKSSSPVVGSIEGQLFSRWLFYPVPSIIQTFVSLDFPFLRIGNTRMSILPRETCY